MDAIDERLVEHYVAEVDEALSKMYGRMSLEAQKLVLGRVLKLVEEKSSELEEDAAAGYHV